MPLDDLNAALRARHFPVAGLKVWGRREGRDIRAMEAPGPIATQLWRAARECTNVTGCWPIIVSTRLFEGSFQSDLAQSIENYDGAEPSHILQEAAALDLEAWVESRLEELGRAAELTEHDFKVIPTRLQDGEFAIDARSKNELALVFLPTPYPWEAFAWLPNAAWNDCPSAEVHCSLMKEWHTSVGAEIAYLGVDTVDLVIKKVATTAPDRLRIGKQLLAYCSDFEDSGPGVAQFLNSSVWNFWWD